MEAGRRLGNHVGDPIVFQPYDIRGSKTAQGYIVDAILPGTGWEGHVISYLNELRRGSFSADPFTMPAPAGTRHFFEFFLAGPKNAAEDVQRFVRSIPGENLQVDFTRAHTDQTSFRIYHTAGFTATPDVLLKTLRTVDRVTGTPTAAVFQWVSDKLGAGGHSLEIRPVDAAGNENTGCTTYTAILSPWPLPPTGLEVHAYSAFLGQVTVKWTPPGDASSNSLISLYRNSGADGRVIYTADFKTAAPAFPTTGSPAKPYMTAALPSTGVSAAGAWVIGARHTLGGIEEDNFTAFVRFVIDDAGIWYGGYPSRPTFLQAVPGPDARITLRVKHDNANEGAAAIRFWLYKSDAGATAVDYSATVGTIERSGARFFEGTGGLTLTEGSVFGFGVRAVATGGQTEVNTALATATPDATPPTSCPASVSMTKVIR